MKLDACRGSFRHPLRRSSLHFGIPGKGRRGARHRARLRIAGAGGRAGGLPGPSRRHHRLFRRELRRRLSPGAVLLSPSLRGRSRPGDHLRSGESRLRRLAHRRAPGERDQPVAPGPASTRLQALGPRGHRRPPRPKQKFLLPDVVPHRDREEPEAHYGNLFFDDITREASNGRLTGKKLNFNFAYPNLYLVTDEGESLLLTHGHYFEAFWSVAAEWTSLARVRRSGPRGGGDVPS